MLDLFKPTFGKTKMREHNMVDDADNLVEASHGHAIIQTNAGWFLRLLDVSREDEFVSDGWRIVEPQNTPWQS